MDELKMLRDVANEMNDEILKLHKQLKVAKEAFAAIGTVMANDGRTWDVDLIEQRIDNIISDTLGKIENTG